MFVAVFFMNDAMNKNTVQSRNCIPHIMVVDDAEDILLMIKIGLEEKNFNVDTFSSAKSAVRAFERNAPDYYKLVLTDIRMPNMNGFALLSLSERKKSIYENCVYDCF